MNDLFRNEVGSEIVGRSAEYDHEMYRLRQIRVGFDLLLAKRNTFTLNCWKYRSATRASRMGVPPWKTKSGRKWPRWSNSSKGGARESFFEKS